MKTQTEITPLRWAAQNTAGHETHGQTSIYDESTGKDIAIVYDGAKHAALLAAAPALLQACKDILSLGDNENLYREWKQEFTALENAIQQAEKGAEK